MLLLALQRVSVEQTRPTARQVLSAVLLQSAARCVASSVSKQPARILIELLL
jgi:hypothetical protein